MFAISPTDIDWFGFLRESEFNSEINFWTPTPWNLTRLEMCKIDFENIRKQIIKFREDRNWKQFHTTIRNGGV